MEYSDLNPRKSSFELEGISYELRPFDLNARVWAHDEFATAEQPNGLQVLSNRISDISDYVVCLKVCWYLLSRRDQKEFGGFSSFLKTIESSKAKFEVIRDMYLALIDCIGVSEPRIEDIKKDVELKKRLAATL